MVENNSRRKLWAAEKTCIDKDFSGMELTRQLSDYRMFYFPPPTKLMCCRRTDKTTSGAVNKPDSGKTSPPPTASDSRSRSSHSGSQVPGFATSPLQFASLGKKGMAGSDSLSQADVNRLLRMSNSQSESALKERVRQMDHSPQLDTMTHTQLQGCMFVLLQHVSQR